MPERTVSTSLHLYLMTAEGTGPAEAAAEVTAALAAAGHATWPGQVQGVPPGEPLTHFFHCWRFPDHHRCAVALVERQSRENDQLLVQVAALDRHLGSAAVAVAGHVLGEAKGPAE